MQYSFLYLLGPSKLWISLFLRCPTRFFRSPHCAFRFTKDCTVASTHRKQIEICSCKCKMNKNLWFIDCNKSICSPNAPIAIQSYIQSLFRQITQMMCLRGLYWRWSSCRSQCASDSCRTWMSFYLRYHFGAISHI